MSPYSLMHGPVPFSVDTCYLFNIDHVACIKLNGLTVHFADKWNALPQECLYDSKVCKCPSKTINVGGYQQEGSPVAGLMSHEV